MTMPPKAILFDCDGVLVDSEAISFDLLATDFARYGVVMTRPEMERRFLGGTIAGIFTGMRADGVALPDNWVETFYDQLYARLSEGTELIAGVTALLDKLDAAGIRYAVGSNGSDRKMQITLGQHPEILSRFNGHLYSGQALGCPKPAPGLWLHAARALGVAPEDCVVIDDSVSGCTGAARAGMRCLGLAEHHDGASLQQAGATVIHHLDEVAGQIGL
ncbi:MAG: HAD family phosphatase [Pseudorhodobacter sp.]|nr:HAD family phosphatase [Pseudorhodobacter sp.]